MNGIYSTAELAKLLNVNESTIKRWSDSGDLACVKTRGGHRRFAVSTVMEFIRKNKLSASTVAIGALPDEDLQAHVLVGNIHKLVPELKKEMMAGSVEGIQKILRIAFVARPKLLELFSELVFPPLVQIGEEWRNKTLTVDQEHLATNALKEALSRFHSELPRKESNNLKAICFCPEGEWHDVAIRCVGYFLDTEGWNVVFLGQSSPAESVLDAIRTHKPHLVAMSSIAPPHERSLMNAINKSIYPAVHRLRGRLALGGPGIKARWENKVKTEYLCDTINDCGTFADPSGYAR
jgi:MerR family transcriptional regulator, light-induced transcriptional regulator